MFFSIQFLIYFVSFSLLFHKIKKKKSKIGPSCRRTVASVKWSNREKKFSKYNWRIGRALLGWTGSGIFALGFTIEKDFLSFYRFLRVLTQDVNDVITLQAIGINIKIDVAYC